MSDLTKNTYKRFKALAQQHIANDYILFDLLAKKIELPADLRFKPGMGLGISLVAYNPDDLAHVSTAYGFRGSIEIIFTATTLEGQAETPSVFVKSSDQVRFADLAGSLVPIEFVMQYGIDIALSIALYELISSVEVRFYTEAATTYLSVDLYTDSGAVYEFEVLWDDVARFFC